MTAVFSPPAGKFYRFLKIVVGHYYAGGLADHYADFLAGIHFFHSDAGYCFFVPVHHFGVYPRIVFFRVVFDGVFYGVYRKQVVYFPCVYPTYERLYSSQIDG